LCLEEFTNDIQQVCWVLTFMKKDCAAIFANCMIQSKNQTGLPCFQTWVSFYMTYVSLFCPINKSTMALMKLEMEEYHQNKCNVDEYVDDFEELIDLSGYTDPLTIVIKFRRGLNVMIQTKIVELGKDRPGDNLPAAWYTMAQLFDQNHIANQAFQNPQKKFQTTLATLSTRCSIFLHPLISQVSHTPTSILQNHTTTGPMLSSGMQCSDHTPCACYQCGSLDHLTPQCKIKYNICAMSSDEKEQLLEQLLVDKDVMVEPVEDVQSQEVCKNSTDFVPHSR
jgi:hypothetical protein